VIRGKGWDSVMVSLQAKGIEKSFGAMPGLRYADPVYEVRVAYPPQPVRRVIVHVFGINAAGVP
jgi:hypothetical protein